MQKITPFLWFDNQAEEAMTNRRLACHPEQLALSSRTRSGIHAPGFTPLKQLMRHGLRVRPAMTTKGQALPAMTNPSTLAATRGRVIPSSHARKNP
jgi:hypothetical protein